LGYHNSSELWSGFISICEMRINAMPAPGPLAISGAVASIDHDGYVAANAIDGNPATTYSGESIGTNYANITFDLGSVKKVASLDIDWFQSTQQTTVYDILLSEDGNTYTTVFSGENQLVLGYQTVQFTPKKARYVRILGYHNSTELWSGFISINEVRINGN